MTDKNKKRKNKSLFPIDDRPVIFSIINQIGRNYVGRFIKSENIFLLSLDDELCDFIPITEISEWWYIDEHPIILSEVLKKRTKKIKDSDKNLKSEKKENVENKDLDKKPAMPSLPPMLKNVIRNIENELGSRFNQVNVIMVNEENLELQTIDVLKGLLEIMVKEENFEMATKIRDIISKKNTDHA